MESYSGGGSGETRGRKAGGVYGGAWDGWEMKRRRRRRKVVIFVLVIVGGA